MRSGKKLYGDAMCKAEVSKVKSNLLFAGTLICPSNGKFNLKTLYFTKILFTRDCLFQ